MRVFHKQRRKQNAINFNVDMEYEEEEENYSLNPHPLGKDGRQSSPEVLVKQTMSGAWTPQCTCKELVQHCVPISSTLWRERQGDPWGLLATQLVS